MTVLILRLKGDEDTLRKGFEAVSQALSAFAPGPPQPQREGRLAS